MPRKVPEWIGATPDTKVPDRVRERVFTRAGERCHRCTRKIAAGEKWTCEHLRALINGGANREGNLDVTCDWCLPAKNAEDVADKSKVYKMRKKDIGVKSRKGPPMPGSKDSPYRRKLNGTTERRDQ